MSKFLKLYKLLDKNRMIPYIPKFGHKKVIISNCLSRDIFNSLCCKLEISPVNPILHPKLIEQKKLEKSVFITRFMHFGFILAT